MLIQSDLVAVRCLGSSTLDTSRQELKCAPLGVQQQQVPLEGAPTGPLLAGSPAHFCRCNSDDALIPTAPKHLFISPDRLDGWGGGEWSGAACCPVPFSNRSRPLTPWSSIRGAFRQKLPCSYSVSSLFKYY